MAQVILVFGTLALLNIGFGHVVGEHWYEGQDAEGQVTIDNERVVETEEAQTNSSTQH